MNEIHAQRSMTLDRVILEPLRGLKKVRCCTSPGVVRVENFQLYIWTWSAYVARIEMRRSFLFSRRNIRKEKENTEKNPGGEVVRVRPLTTFLNFPRSQRATQSLPSSRPRIPAFSIICLMCKLELICYTPDIQAILAPYVIFL